MFPLGLMKAVMNLHLTWNCINSSFHSQCSGDCTAVDNVDQSVALQQ